MNKQQILQVSVSLQELAAHINKFLQRKAGEPVGFALVVATGLVLQHTTNCSKADAILLLREMSESLKGAQVPAHYNDRLQLDAGEAEYASWRIVGGRPSVPAPQPLPFDPGYVHAYLKAALQSVEPEGLTDPQAAYFLAWLEQVGTAAGSLPPDDAQDAARWRWLRSRSYMRVESQTEDAMWSQCFDSATALEAAIDAEMRADGAQACETCGGTGIAKLSGEFCTNCNGKGRAYRPEGARDA